jgi:hypothetical protein
MVHLHHCILFLPRRSQSVLLPPKKDLAWILSAYGDDCCRVSIPTPATPARNSLTQNRVPFQILELGRGSAHSVPSGCRRVAPHFANDFVAAPTATSSAQSRPQPQNGLTFHQCQDTTHQSSAARTVFCGALTRSAFRYEHFMSKNPPAPQNGPPYPILYEPCLRVPSRGPLCLLTL